MATQSEEEIFHDYLRSMTTYGARPVEISRDALLLPQAFHIYKDTRFEIGKLLMISFRNEDGVDCGGPSREFFSQIYTAVLGSEKETILFEGNAYFCNAFKEYSTTGPF